MDDLRDHPTVGTAIGDGVSVTPLFDADLVRALRSLYDGIGLDREHRWYVSSRHADDQVGRRLDASAQELVADRVSEVFPDHRIVFASFCSKGVRSDEPVWFHHDVTFVDEREHRSLLVWTPLIDCDADGAVLQAVPGSHRWSTGLRPSHGPAHPQITRDLQEQLAPLAVATPLAAGEALVMDAATIHGSAPNDSDVVRPALALMLVPRGVDVVHFHLDADGALTGHAVDDPFFTLHDLTTPPVGFPSVEPWGTPATADDIERGAAAAAAAMPASQEPQPPWVRRQATEPAPAIRTTFLDEARQREFDERGFTTIDLLDEPDAAALAERFEALYTGERVGFHTSLESFDYPYRDVLHEELVRTFGGLVDRYFLDHDILMTAATVKWPGADSTIPIHQDWSVVDETRFRTVNLWIPLVHTTEENGSLYVLPGSHNAHRKLRINGGFPSWYHDPAWNLDPSSFEQVCVRPGQAIVTDHALLHRSPSNVSDEARIAVVVSVKPVEAAMYHWHLTEDEEIVRYTVDDSTFFRRIVALADPSEVLAGLPAEVVEFDQPRPDPGPDPASDEAPGADAARVADEVPTADEVPAESEPVAAVEPVGTPASGGVARQTRRQSLRRHLLRWSRHQSTQR